MTVDQLSVPASIDSTTLDKATANMWAIAGDKSGSISGKFLSGGIPKIDLDGVSDIAVTKDGSTGSLLKFTFKLAKPIDPPVAFGLTVEKDAKNGTTVESKKYAVNSTYTLQAPTITEVQQAAPATVATVTGTNFYSNSKNKFSAKIRPEAAKDDKSDIVVGTTAPSSATSFTLDTSKFDKTVVPGCYVALAEVGALLSAPSTDKLMVAATPKITKAETANGGKSLKITGEQLVSTKDCGGSDPAFELIKTDGASFPTQYRSWPARPRRKRPLRCQTGST